MHRPLRVLLLLLSVILAMPVAGWAMLIETGPGVQVGGFLVSDDGKILKLRIPISENDEVVKEFDRTKVKVLHQVDRKKLEKLAPDQPKGYRDYAEELATQKADPEARITAIRLFLIAAHLDPREHGVASLLKMSSIAGNPKAARAYRALAFLLDATHNEKLLSADPGKSTLPKDVDDAALARYQESLQYLRAGHLTFAREMARRVEVAKVFSVAPGVFDQKAFLQACSDAACVSCKKSPGRALCQSCAGKGNIPGIGKCTTCNGKKEVACSACDGVGVNPMMPEETLRNILNAELWATSLRSGRSPEKTQDRANWSALLQQRQIGPVRMLSLETITEFDPRKCLYRNGGWVAP